MRIAILTNEPTMDRCTGSGCFKAFNLKKDAFEVYNDKDELVSFTHAGGDLERKIERWLENKVDVIHLSTCLRAKYKNYEALKTRLEADFKVVGYTHGSKNRKSLK